MTWTTRSIKAATALAFAVLLEQHFYAFREYSTYNSSTDLAGFLPDFIRNSSNSQCSANLQAYPLPTNESFGACLMMKEDNEILFEWLAYHYTMLPLRYVVIGSDEGNHQDPEDVLRLWKEANTGLEYWVWNSTKFVDRHGDTGKPTRQHEYAHHMFAYRQRGFVTTCSEFMKDKGLHWVTYFDNDEFLVLNRWGDDDADLPPTEPNETAADIRKRMRDALPPLGSPVTILDVIQNLSGTIAPVGPCYTMPRLLFGALENVTCPAADEVTTLAKNEFNFPEMSTLRFVQHAIKTSFQSAKFGKVMVDLSQLSREHVSDHPKNVHRPFKPECRHAAVGFPDAVFYLNHYVGSWERYSARKDERRSREAWMRRAFVEGGDACDKANHEWFPRFLEMMGMERAKFLLGVTRTLSPTC